jgi:hypothetical protein
MDWLNVNPRHNFVSLHHPDDASHRAGAHPCTGFLLTHVSGSTTVLPSCVFRSETVKLKTEKLETQNAPLNNW